MRVIADRAQIPSGDAEIRREFVTRLHIERLLERRDLIGFKDGSRRLDDIADDLAQSGARRIGAVFDILLQCRANCLPIRFQKLGHTWIDFSCLISEIGIKNPCIVIRQSIDPRFKRIIPILPKLRKRRNILIQGRICKKFIHLSNRLVQISTNIFIGNTILRAILFNLLFEPIFEICLVRRIVQGGSIKRECLQLHGSRSRSITIIRLTFTSNRNPLLRILHQSPCIPILN